MVQKVVKSVGRPRTRIRKKLSNLMKKKYSQENPVVYGYRCSHDNPNRKMDILLDNFNEFCEIIKNMGARDQENFYTWCEELDDEI